MYEVIVIYYTIYPNELIPSFSPYLLYKGRSLSEAEASYYEAQATLERNGCDEIFSADNGSFSNFRKESDYRIDKDHFAHISLKK